jgi:hypothetical protein
MGVDGDFPQMIFMRGRAYRGLAMQSGSEMLISMQMLLGIRNADLNSNANDADDDENGQ